jgi:hypothetical protein
MCSRASKQAEGNAVLIPFGLTGSSTEAGEEVPVLLKVERRVHLTDCEEIQTNPLPFIRAILPRYRKLCKALASSLKERGKIR